MERVLFTDQNQLPDGSTESLPASENPSTRSPEQLSIMSSDGTVLLMLPSPDEPGELATLLADMLHAPALRASMQACTALRPLLGADVPTLIDRGALRAALGPVLAALQEHTLTVRRFRQMQRRKNYRQLLKRNVGQMNDEDTL